MNIELTGAETGDQLIKKLVHLRFVARRVVGGLSRCRDSLEHQKRIRDNLPPHIPEGAQAAVDVAVLEENMLQWRSMEIEIGNFLLPLCNALDRKATREQIFEAIGCSRGDRDTALVRQYGSKAHHLICILDLENSATKDDATIIKPLKWCHTMAFMHLLNASPKFGRMVHDVANETFNGAFGDFQETPLMERLAGRPV